MSTLGLSGNDQISITKVAIHRELFSLLCVLWSRFEGVVWVAGYHLVSFFTKGKFLCCSLINLSYFDLSTKIPHFKGKKMLIKTNIWGINSKIFWVFFRYSNNGIINIFPIIVKIFTYTWVKDCALIILYEISLFLWNIAHFSFDPLKSI